MSTNNVFRWLWTLLSLIQCDSLIRFHVHTTCFERFKVPLALFQTLGVLEVSYLVENWLIIQCIFLQIDISCCVWSCSFSCAHHRNAIVLTNFYCLGCAVECCKGLPIFKFRFSTFQIRIFRFKQPLVLRFSYLPGRWLKSFDIVIILQHCSGKAWFHSFYNGAG